MMYDYEAFKSTVLQLTKIDLNAYKENQMKRRIDTLIEKHGYKGYEDYVAALRTNRERFEEFVTYLTINAAVGLSGQKYHPEADGAVRKESEDLECGLFHGG